MRPRSPEFRRHFDALLAGEIQRLPAPFKAVLERVPVVAEDVPSPRRQAELGLNTDTNPCGLHEGVPDTESGDGPFEIGRTTLWRDAIANQAGWPEDDDPMEEDHAALREEIHITLLHELGHQLGMDEKDLERLGYG